MADLWAFLLLGLTAGGAYALTSLGIVAVYRGSGVLNLAQGAMGVVGAYAFWEMSANAGLPIGIAIAGGVLTGGIVGAIVYVVVVRPLRDAHDLAQLIATLGVLLVLQSAALLRYSAQPIAISQFLGHGSLTVFGASLRLDTVIVLVIVVVLTVALQLAFRRTRLGLAATALYEQPMAAASVGISPHPTGFLTWTLGGVLAGAAAIVVLPTTGLSPTSVGGLLFPALAAGLVGRFRRFGIAVIVAYLMGIAQSILTLYHVTPSIGDSIPFVAILVALVVSGTTVPGRGVLQRRLPRVTSGVMSWRRKLVWLVVPIGAVALLGVSWAAAITATAIAVIVALSIVVVSGFAGQISLAPFALAGVGSLAAARASGTWGLPFPVAVLFAVAAGAVFGALLGLPAARVRGLDLAIATVGFALVVEYSVLSYRPLVGSYGGILLGSVDLFGLDLAPWRHPQSFAILCVVLAWGTFVAVNSFRRSRGGRRLLAIRGSERGALSVGVSTVQAKIAAFALSGAFAGLAGGLLTFQVQVASFADYGIFRSIQAVAWTAVGGIGYAGGALIAGIATSGGLAARVLESVETFVEYAGVIAGVSVIVVLQVHPDGEIDRLMHSYRRLLRRVVKPEVSASTTPTPAPPRQLETRQRAKPRGEGLVVQDLSVSYGHTRALDRVDLSVQPGRVVGVVGPNGAGKTTLIDAVTGFARATGTVRFNGVDISRWHAAPRARVGLARTFQDLQLFADLSVRENLLVATDNHSPLAYVSGMFRPDVGTLDESALDAASLFGLEGLLDRSVEELPLGVQHLVALARAAAAAPDVICLDEPTAGLGSTERSVASRAIRALADVLGIGVLIIEHNLDVIREVCDEVVALDFGQILASGEPTAVMADDAVRRAYLGEIIEPSVLDVAAPTGEPLVATTAEPESWRPLEAVEPAVNGRSSDDAARLLLEVSDLQASYGLAPVVRGVSLSVDAGEVVALLGANGAGKTSTLMAIAGYIPTTEGSVRLDGDLIDGPSYGRCASRMAIVLEGRRSVSPSLTVRDNLRLGRIDSREAVEIFPQLERLLDRPAGQLSGGEQQMLSLARAVCRRPEILLIDELSFGLAPIVCRQLFAAIRAVATRFEMGVLLVEQNVHYAAEVADRAVVLREGAVALELGAHEIQHRERELEEAYLSGPAPG